MDDKRLVELAERLMQRDRDLAAPLEAVWEAARELREEAHAAVEAFRGVLLARGAGHLARIEVGPVEPDEKHVDCVQFRIARGRWQALYVGKAAGKATLVGPFKLGHSEQPCRDFPLRGPEVERGLEDLLLTLIEKASER